MDASHYIGLSIRVRRAIQLPCRKASSGLRRVPFEVSLADFESFRHRRGKHTVWLDPQPNDAVERLHVAIGNSLLDCDNEFKNSNRRFQPHLSVGQCQGREHTSQLVDQLQTAWEPVSFDVKKVSLISRNDPPDDVFLVENEIDLGN